MASYQDEVPPHHVSQIIKEASDYFGEADKRERNAEDRAKQIAQAHTRGWELVARAISEGLASIARAVENNGRR